MEKIIEENYDIIFQRYCEIYPEKINSDFCLEDNYEELEEFIKNYMEELCI